MNYYETFKREFVALQQKFGVTGKRNFLYMGWQEPMNRRAARKIARNISRRKTRRS